jgi:murein DD-endopeptidase MepM/ murein hydrolase activator NlpD
MSEIISRQHIGSRKKPSRKSAFRPAGIISLAERNMNMIQRIKQKPAKVRGGFRRENPGASEKPPLKLRHPFFQNSRQRSGQESGPSREKRRSPSASLTMPFLPAAGVCLFILVALLALNWDESSLAWMHREVVPVNPGADEAGRFNLALYAGLAPAPGDPASASRAEADSGDAIPLDLTETFEWKSYTVKKGDSVSKIAALHALSMDAIIASNNISNARMLRQGEKLRIPNMDGIPYIVKKGDSLSRISQSMGVPLEAILDANDLQRDLITAGQLIFVPGARMRSEDLKLALGELFKYPVSGARLSSPFGWRNDPISGIRRHHAAIDLAVPAGTTVKAAMDGKVSALGFNATYGNYIILSHGNAYQSMYAHLKQFSVKEGDRVSQGAKIGEVGSTGYSTGPHLHFAVYKNGRAVNPLDFLNS